MNVDQAVQESEQGTGTEIQEGRPFWKLRPLKIVITLAAVILAGLVAIGLVVSRPLARAVGEAIGLGDTAVTIWGILKWQVLLGLAAVVVVILYYATPNVQQPKFKWISLGAVVAIITWVIASALFGLYVSQFSNYSKTYGSRRGRSSSCSGCGSPTSHCSSVLS